MRRILIIEIGAALLLATQAMASTTYTCAETVSGSSFTLTCIPASTCSDNLNFSKACNSMYVAAIFH